VHGQAIMLSLRAKKNTETRPFGVKLSKEILKEDMNRRIRAKSHFLSLHLPCHSKVVFSFSL
jgi:hypothetical protein